MYTTYLCTIFRTTRQKRTTLVLVENKSALTRSRAIAKGRPAHRSFDAREKETSCLKKHRELRANRLADNNSHPVPSNLSPCLDGLSRQLCRNITAPVVAREM